MVDYFSSLIAQSRGQFVGVQPLIRPLFASSAMHVLSSQSDLSAFFTNPDADMRPDPTSIASPAQSGAEEDPPPDLVPPHMRQVMLPASLLGAASTTQEIRQPLSQEIDQDENDEDMVATASFAPLHAMLDEERDVSPDLPIPSRQKATDEEQNVEKGALPLLHNNDLSHSPSERNAASHHIHTDHEESPSREILHRSGRSSNQPSERNGTSPQNADTPSLREKHDRISFGEMSIDPHIEAEHRHGQADAFTGWRGANQPIPLRDFEENPSIHANGILPSSPPHPTEESVHSRSTQVEATVYLRPSHQVTVPHIMFKQADTRKENDDKDVKEEMRRPERPSQGLMPLIAASPANVQHQKPADIHIPISKPYKSAVNNEQPDADVEDRSTSLSSPVHEQPPSPLGLASPKKETDRWQAESGQPSVPTIRIHIGRVEVRTTSAPSRQAPRRNEAAPRQGLTLNEYMQQHRRDLQ